MPQHIRFGRISFLDINTLGIQPMAFCDWLQGQLKVNRIQYRMETQE